MRKLTSEERAYIKWAIEDQERNPIIKPEDEKHICSVCGQDYTGFGNNALPVNEGRCCDKCNTWVVIPHRVQNTRRGKPVY